MKVNLSPAQGMVAQPAALALVASDNEWSARSLESILGAQGIRVVRAQTVEETVAQAESANCQVLLLDADLPGLTGVEVCKSLRALPSVGASTPIIMLRPRPWRRDERFEALRAGAWECIGIPADSEELLLQLHTYISAKAETDAIRAASLIDPVTGAYNLLGIMRRVQELAADAIRFSRPLGCVALAPDPRTASEHAPSATTRAEPTFEFLRRVSRASDVIGRSGPAEFLIVAPNSGPDGTLRLARRLLDAADSMPRGTPQQVRLRAGYYAVGDLRATPVEPVDLLRRAAAALRQSQETAGERLCVFSSDVTPSPN